MEVRMTIGLSGPTYSVAAGDKRDFPESEAIRLIEAGYAVPVAEKKTERAVAPAPAEKRGKRGKANVVSDEGNDASNE